MNLAGLYNQIEAKKRRILQIAVEIVPKWEVSESAGRSRHKLVRHRGRAALQRRVKARLTDALQGWCSLVPVALRG